MTKEWLLDAAPTFAFFAVAVLVAWAAPAVIVSPVVTSQDGPEWVLRWEASKPWKPVTFDWTHTFTVRDHEEHVEFLAQVPVSIDCEEFSDPGTADLHVNLTVFVNHKTAYESYGGSFMSDPGASGRCGIGYRGMYPYTADELQQGLFELGANTVRMEAEFGLNVYRPGSQTYEARVGPMTVQRYYADHDGDGVIDVYQWSPVHTGAVAVPLAIVLGHATRGATTHWVERQKNTAGER